MNHYPLELLTQCFHEVLVPQAVVVELGNLTLPSYIKTVTFSPRGTAFVEGALGRLHREAVQAKIDQLVYQHGLYLSSAMLERLKQKLNDS